MRIAVDLPAPFSPTMAWIVPGLTTMLTLSLARTSPKRFVIFLSSSIRSLRAHRVGDFDLASDDLLLSFFGFLDRFGRDETLVVLIHRVADTIFVQTKNVNS